MTKDLIGFVFPGQGSQYVGMAKDLYESFDSAKKVFDKANEILGFDLKEICFNGPEEALKQTYVTQPAVFVHSIALISILDGKIKADAPARSAGGSAGHSLGEYTALVYAGALSFESGLNLVKLRGELMQTAGEINKGTMAAIIGLEKEKIFEVCKTASAQGIVQPANFNSPGQVVISGSVEGVKSAMALAKESGAKIVKELVVHGAFHSPLMESAKEALKNALAETEFSKLRIPVYRNIDAKVLTTNSHADEIRNSLIEQLTSSVCWDDSVRNMISNGVNEFVEIGPGKVLQGLVKRINPNVKTSGFDRAEEIKSFLKQ